MRRGFSQVRKRMQSDEFNGGIIEFCRAGCLKMKQPVRHVPRAAIFRACEKWKYKGVSKVPAALAADSHVELIALVRVYYGD